MSQPGPRTSDPLSKGGVGRLQALADGIFAVAMTLLVLNLPTGAGTDKQVSGVLSDALPHLLLYFASILMLGALWFSHRNAFEYFRRTDHPHTWLNLIMLTFVALVPWTTALVAQHVHEPLAVTVYAANLGIVTALDAAAWRYATGPAALTEELTPRFVAVSRLLTVVPVAGSVVAIGVCWLSTWAGLAVIVALALLPVTGVSYRVQHRLSSQG
ncbi:MAG TPA: TMEM175 family protein [Streptosporangiaceae bacterium]|jgi:uncharacterized membrane protein